MAWKKDPNGTAEGVDKKHEYIWSRYVSREFPQLYRFDRLRTADRQHLATVFTQRAGNDAEYSTPEAAMSG